MAKKVRGVMEDDEHNVVPFPSGGGLPRKKYWQMDREEFFQALQFMVLHVQRGAKPLEMQVVTAAQHGDWLFLAEYLELDFEITNEIRKFLVAVLRQEVKKPNNRPASLKTRMRETDIAQFISEQVKHGKKKERAIEDAEKKFGLGRRHIQRCLREHNRRQNSIDQFRRALSTLLNHGQEKGWLPPGSLQVRLFPDGSMGFRHMSVTGSALKQYRGRTEANLADTRSPSQHWNHTGWKRALSSRDNKSGLSVTTFTSQLMS